MWYMLIYVISTLIEIQIAPFGQWELCQASFWNKSSILLSLLGYVTLQKFLSLLY